AIATSTADEIVVHKHVFTSTLELEATARIGAWNKCRSGSAIAADGDLDDISLEAYLVTEQHHSVFETGTVEVAKFAALYTKLTNEARAQRAPLSRADANSRDRHVDNLGRRNLLVLREFV